MRELTRIISRLRATMWVVSIALGDLQALLKGRYIKRIVNKKMLGLTVRTQKKYRPKWLKF